MVEVHPEPEHALSDGAQSLHFREFEKLFGQMEKLEAYARKNL
jgi:3-deoxy-7-phosphoheptulonate synthase